LSFVLALLAGCHGNCDLVEAELRTREIQLADLRAEREHLIAHVEALEHEIAALRGGPLNKVPPEAAVPTHALHALVLGRQTGGLDNDGKPGDEALQVLVEPRDGDGHTVMAAGTLTIRAAEIVPEGLKKPLCSWEVTGDELRHSWKNGLLTTGYYLVLPWKTWPANDKVRVIAQLTLADGRLFEAEKDVTVRLPPPGNRKPPRDGVDGPPLPTSHPEGPAVLWQPAKNPSLIDAVEFRAPVPLPGP
jgi:hypothetical protein